MRRFSAMRFLLVAGLLLLLCVPLARYLARKPVAHPGTLLTSPQAIARRQAVAAKEGLRPEQASAAEMALQQAEELAQIRQWQKAREKTAR